MFERLTLRDRRAYKDRPNAVVTQSPCLHGWDEPVLGEESESPTEDVKF